MNPATINTTTCKVLTDSGLVDQASVVTLGADLKTVTINPNANLLPSVTYRVRVTTGVQDAAGNAKATQEEWTFRTDDIAPTITTRTPASGASAQSRDVDIVVGFSEAMLSSSITTTTVKLTKTSNGAVVTAPVTLTTSTSVTMNPTASLDYSTQYTVTILGGASGVKDLAGNPLVSTSTWTFTTVAPTYTLVYNYSGTSFDDLDESSDKTASGLNLQDTSTSGTYPLYNKIIKKCVVTLSRTGSSFGGDSTVRCYICSFDDMDTTKATIGTMSATSITTSSSGASYTFENAAQSYALQLDDCIMIRNDNQDDGNFISVRRTDSDEWDHGIKVTREPDGAGHTDSGRDFPAALYT